MNHQTILQKSRDLQKILSPLNQADLPHNLSFKAKAMLLQFFGSFSHGNNSYLIKVDKIDPDNKDAYNELCGILQSFISDIENQILISPKEFEN